MSDMQPFKAETDEQVQRVASSTDPASVPPLPSSDTTRFDDLMAICTSDPVNLTPATLEDGVEDDVEFYDKSEASAASSSTSTPEKCDETVNLSDATSNLSLESKSASEVSGGSSQAPAGPSTEPTTLSQQSQPAPIPSSIVAAPIATTNAQTSMFGGQPAVPPAQPTVPAAPYRGPMKVSTTTARLLVGIAVPDSPKYKIVWEQLSGGKLRLHENGRQLIRQSKPARHMTTRRPCAISSMVSSAQMKQSMSRSLWIPLSLRNLRPESCTTIPSLKTWSHTSGASNMETSRVSLKLSVRRQHHTRSCLFQRHMGSRLQHLSMTPVHYKLELTSVVT